jgi:hypothetical protein
VNLQSDGSYGVSSSATDDTHGRGYSGSGPGGSDCGHNRGLSCGHMLHGASPTPTTGPRVAPAAPDHSVKCASRSVTPPTIVGTASKKIMFLNHGVMLLPLVRAPTMLGT